MVKFDVVSGFLGSGKTTLIKKILASLGGQEKIVLIENDFGEVNVDREILNVEGFEIYELSNGCVCCKLKGDFLFTLKQILKQKVDRVIFEPSGIFILDEIFDLFKDFQISDKCYINTITTVVDAENFFKHIQSYSNFFKSQISNASAIVVSKTQFLKVEDIGLIKDKLQTMNEQAVILTKDWSDLSPIEILTLIKSNPVKRLSGTAHSSGHDFETWGIETSTRLDFNQLKSILDKCTTDEYGTILRGKGIIRSEGEGNFLEFQYLDGKYSITESNHASAGIVSFIGTNINKKALGESFK